MKGCSTQAREDATNYVRESDVMIFCGFRTLCHHCYGVCNGIGP